MGKNNIIFNILLHIYRNLKNVFFFNIYFLLEEKPIF